MGGWERTTNVQYRGWVQNQISSIRVVVNCRAAPEGEDSHSIIKLLFGELWFSYYYLYPVRRLMEIISYFGDYGSFCSNGFG
mmetsp:Transcript_31069/g.33380  ORF Transcript_31069/g.33380 Transcript_31069/m.33380 type:complete len:82 (-) Transcript_31069:135-380(-)